MSEFVSKHDFGFLEKIGYYSIIRRMFTDSDNIQLYVNGI